MSKPKASSVNIPRPIKTGKARRLANHDRSRVRPEKWDFAYRMRKEPTQAERVMWWQMRRRRIGIGFRRQYIIFGWIVDFYCVEAGLVVEVDGPIHESRREYDAHRDRVMRESGIVVMRFTNDRVLNDTKAVVKEIRAKLISMGYLTWNGVSVGDR